LQNNIAQKKVELGKTNLSQSRITKIVSALETSPGYIMGWKSSIILSEEEEKIILDSAKSHDLDFFIHL
jgi:hypothetical protein